MVCNSETNNNSSTAKLNKWFFLFSAAIFTIVFLLLIIYACIGPRGSDGYWYLNDIENLLAGEKPITNMYWAGSFYRNPTTPENNYFIHHTPVLYLVLPVARLFGAYMGWIVTGVASTIFTGVCLGFLIWKFTKKISAACLGYALWLVLPLTFWQSANVLQESIMTGGVMLTFTCWLIATQKQQLKWWYLTMLICAFGIWVTPIFMIIIIGLIISFLFQSKNQLKKSFFISRLIFTLLTLAIAVFFHISQSYVFPSTGMPTLTAMLQENIPGKGNGAWHLYFDPEPVTFSLIIEKIKIAVVQQFELASSCIFRWPSNLFAISCFLGLWLFRKDNKKWIYWAAVILTGAYAGFVSLHQNQFRTILLITPVLLVGAVVLLAQIKRMWKISLVIMWIATLALLAIDCKLANHIHSDALKDRNELKAFRKATNNCDGPFVITEVHQLIVYAVRPEPVLLWDPKTAQDNRSDEVFDSFGPKYMICDKQKSMDWQKHMDWKIASSREISGTRWVLHRIEPLR